MHLSTALILNELADEVHDNSVKHGFWEGPLNFGEKIALMHSELSEALEALRHPKQDSNCPEFTNEVIELADCIIRILDYCGYQQYPIGEALFAKHEYNKTRPYKHGKNF